MRPCRVNRQTPGLSQFGEAPHLAESRLTCASSRVSAIAAELSFARKWIGCLLSNRSRHSRAAGFTRIPGSIDADRASAHRLLMNLRNVVYVACRLRRVSLLTFVAHRALDSHELGYYVRADIATVQLATLVTLGTSL